MRLMHRAGLATPDIDYDSGTQSMGYDPNKGREGSKNGLRCGDPSRSLIF